MFPLLDKPSEDIKRFFDEASEYIENTLNQNNKILVHCFAGKSRSTTIMISYLCNYPNYFD
jgi:protein-tyrosine phosphatase